MSHGFAAVLDRLAGRGSQPPPKLSLIVIAYDMAREIPRTLRSLSPPLQTGLRAEDYEIVVVDNGSPIPLNRAECERWGARVVLHRMEDADVSPVRAINTGLELAKGELLGVMIDGARLASPGLLAHTVTAARMHPRAIVATLGFHLGPDVQTASIAHGYDQNTEDELLARSGWEKDGYALFNEATLAGSSAGGWFQPIAESNAIFMRREMWNELEGFEPRFVSPGGGLANLDLYARACALPDSKLVILLGEGTFHQVHGGVSTNAAKSRWGEFHEEYRSIRDCDYVQPEIEPWYFGQACYPALRWLETSARHARRKGTQSTGEGGLEWRCDLPSDLLTGVQAGVLQSRYRGRRFFKSPFDVALYQQLIERVSPRSVLEIGTKDGGSALWFADAMTVRGGESRVISIDIEPPPDLDDERITCLRGDALCLEEVLTPHAIESLPRPLLVVEDSAHFYDTSLAVLRFFDPYLLVGDYIVVEDGVVQFLPGQFYQRYDNGPNRAVSAFLFERGEDYEVDRTLCDFFGFNATFNPNGWLRRR